MIPGNLGSLARLTRIAHLTLIRISNMSIMAVSGPRPQTDQRLHCPPRLAALDGLRREADLIDVGVAPGQGGLLRRVLLLAARVGFRAGGLLPLLLFALKGLGQFGVGLAQKVKVPPHSQLEQ